MEYLGLSHYTTFIWESIKISNSSCVECYLLSKGMFNEQCGKGDRSMNSFFYIRKNVIKQLNRFINYITSSTY